MGPTFLIWVTKAYQAEAAHELVKAAATTTNTPPWTSFATVKALN